MSSAGMSQKEYLKKYLSAGSDDKKKKKKKSKSKPVVNRLRIVDDDIDIHNMRPLDEDELELYELQEDAPQIAGIIDERPEEVKIKEKFGSKKWKVVADENDMGIKIIDKSTPKGALPSEQISLQQGRNDEDMSPPRKGNKHSDEMSENEKPHDSGSLQSRKSCQRPDSLKRESVVNKKSHRYDSDESPPRKSKKNDSDESPPRRSNQANLGGSSHHRKVANNFSNESPPHKSRKKEWEKSNQSKKKDKYDSDVSPPRKSKAENSPPSRRQRNYDSDESPPRQKKRENAVDSLPIARRQKYDSDESPPRRNRKNNSEKAQPHRNFVKNGSDESPPRKNRQNSKTPPRKDFLHKTSQRGRRESPVSRIQEVSEHRRERRKSDSDESPPRRQRRRDSVSPPNKGRKRDSFSPARREKERRRMSQSPVRSRAGRDGQEARKSRWTDNDVQHKERNFGNSSGKGFDQNRDGRNYSSQRRRDPEESPERRKQTTSKEDFKKDKTLDGRKAGLVGAGELKAEIEDLRQREKEMFEKMDVNVSGRGAAPIMRDRKTGKKRDLEEEAREKKEKNEKQAERDAKYMEWGKGLKQVTDKAQKMEEDLHEMAKPLARYADDADLDKYLRHQEREGDPMLDYIRSKNKSEGDKSKPRYEGSFMPNRFGIRPGYRWDGVDRSNEYEKQWFETQNAKKAVEEEAYKWSTSDM